MCLILKNRLANTTFERYFVEDNETHKEVKDIYYQLINDENIVNKIFKMFGIESENAHCKFVNEIQKIRGSW